MKGSIFLLTLAAVLVASLASVVKTSEPVDVISHDDVVVAKTPLAQQPVLVAETPLPEEAPLPEKAALPESRATRNNLSLGSIQTGDRLLARNYLYQPGRPNTIQTQDFIYRGNATTRITYIGAWEIGPTQYATISRTAGGLGGNNVTLRVTSARGYGYNYQIEVYGR